MIGFKLFNKDLTHKGYQYELDKINKFDDNPNPCEEGFRFCRSIVDAFKFLDLVYDDTIICEIEAFGDIITDDNIIYITKELRIIKEVPKILLKNGYITFFNEGYFNSNERNYGYFNSGRANSGNDNSGCCNSGDENSGSYNSGNENSGDFNTGNKNSGLWNCGNCNSGDSNSGVHNSGDFNSGDWNSGMFNSGNCNSGMFNTDEPFLRMFNKESNWKMSDWFRSYAKSVMSRMPVTHSDSIPIYHMSELEIEKHPEAKTTGGYIKKYIVTKEDRQKWWDGLEEKDKQAVYELPNFDAKIFEECTMIHVEI